MPAGASQANGRSSLIIAAEDAAERVLDRLMRCGHVPTLLSLGVSAKEAAISPLS